MKESSLENDSGSSCGTGTLQGDKEKESGHRNNRNGMIYEDREHIEK